MGIDLEIESVRLFLTVAWLVYMDHPSNTLGIDLEIESVLTDVKKGKKRNLSLCDYFYNNCIRLWDDMIFLRHLNI